MLRNVVNIFRLLRIVCILQRHSVLFFWRSEDSTVKGRRLARAFENMGPTFIKLGQALSTRSDLVGQEVALALASLRDNIPPFPTKQLRQIIERDLGKPIEQLFATFDDTPAAAASIAQVHFATLPTGQEVAVKVLRPHIAKAFARDIALFYWLAEWASRMKPIWRKRFKPVQVVAMFEETIKLELDLRFEAASAVELKSNTRADKGFYVPTIYWEFTSMRVLVLERIRGISVGDVAALSAAGHDLNRIVDVAAVSFFKQVFRDGFFHADLHPGNLFVLPNGDLAVVDFGIMGRLSKQNRIYLAHILHGFLKEDYYKLAQVHFDAGYVPAHKSVDNFALALMAITKPIIGRKLNEISVARMLGQLFATAEAFEMEVQPHLLLLQKNMMITEGVGRMLHPEVNMWQVAQPLIEAWAEENMGLRAQLKERTQEFADMIKRLPVLVREAEAAFERVNGGGLKLHPDTVASIFAQRLIIQRRWMLFGILVLAALAAIFHI